MSELKAKYSALDPSMTSAFVSPCQNVIAAHYGALPEPARKKQSTGLRGENTAIMNTHQMQT